MRYYLYVSDAKLDMLFEQIDRSALKRVSAEVKVDLKLASVTLTRAANPAPARAAKLRVVERFIDHHHHVGDVANPGTEYFRGQMAMTWGWLHWPGDLDENGLPRRNVALFQGFQGHHTVGLAGSGRHVLSWNGIGEGQAMFGSAAADIYWALDQHTSNAPELADQLRGIRLPRGERVGLAQTLNMSLIQGPTQFLEFLAVPLARENQECERRFNDSDAGSVRALSTVLGSPLYVALASGPGATTGITDPARAGQADCD